MCRIKKINNAKHVCYPLSILIGPSSRQLDVSYKKLISACKPLRYSRKQFFKKKKQFSLVITKVIRLNQRLTQLKSLERRLTRLLGQ